MHYLPVIDCTQASPCACIRPEGLSCCLGYNTSLPQRVWCTASSHAPKHCKVQPVHPPSWQGSTQMDVLIGTDDAQASPCGCIRPESVHRSL